ncbi:MAG TPA: hypothetical protein VM580_18960, partial [Labilithrix sp.]|nr:hypothetical protein [Labilithrix sp.]
KDAERIDAAYFFNPFAETLLLPGGQDFAADRFAGRSAADIVVAERFLEQARPGTRVVTFCGFGGSVPSNYDRLARETWDEGELELWERR